LAIYLLFCTLKELGNLLLVFCCVEEFKLEGSKLFFQVFDGGLKLCLLS